MNQQSLLKEVLARGEYHVAAFRSDVAHQFEERPVIVNVPEEVRKKNQECREAAEPYPLVEKDAALFGEEQADNNSETEERDGILFLQAKARDHAEPQPVAWSVALNREHGEVGAAHPKIGFEAVCAKQTSIGKILRCDKDGDCAQKQGEAASAKFAGKEGGLYDKERRREGGDETNGAQRVSEHSAANVDEERNQRRLVNVSPGEVITARNVVELIAKISVAVVEVDVEEEVGQGDGEDNHHAAGKKGLLLAAGWTDSGWGGSHGKANELRKKNSGRGVAVSCSLRRIHPPDMSLLVLPDAVRRDRSG